MIFDLDGTLVDSAPDIAISMNIMLQELGYPTHDLAQVRNWMGNGAGKLIKRALTGKMNGEPTKELFKRAQQIFFDVYEQNIHAESTLYEGVLEGLNILREQPYFIACVTNKPRRFTPPLLKAFNLKQYFDSQT